MLPDKPGHATEVLRCAVFRFVCDEDLERELRQRTGGYDEEVLALDNVLNLPKQCFVQCIRSRKIKRQRLAEPIVCLTVIDVEQLGAMRTFCAPCPIII